MKITLSDEKLIVFGNLVAKYQKIICGSRYKISMIKVDYVLNFDVPI